MTKRYLMRLGKTPFEVVDAFHSLERNTLGTNSGNLIYGAASHKLFSTSDTVVDANYYRINAGMADQVNDEYDGFILPLANAFRPDFEDQLLRTAQFLERLKIPFIMMSGGAQLPLDGDPSALKAMEPTVKRFARAVLKGSSALSVRGEMTADYLRSLGFHDVVVVGCPSMALHGPGHRVEVPEHLEPGAPVAYNMETNDPFGGDLIDDAERHYDATYIAQEHGSLEMMLWATDPYTTDDERLPLLPSHPQFSAARAEIYLDAYPWIDRMSQMAFSFGARAHGNIAAVLGGTPCVMLAHDSRTLELAQHHEIPYLIRGAASNPVTVRELYEHADFAAFNKGHADRFEVLSSFIHENGFEHIYDPGQERALAAYEGRIAEVDFAPPVRAVWPDEPPEVAQRNAVLQDRDARRKRAQAQIRRDLAKDRRKHEDQIAQLSRRLDEAEEQLAQSQQRAERAEERVAKADQQLTDLTARLADVARAAEHAGDRAERAVRLPTRVKSVMSRLRPGR